MLLSFSPLLSLMALDSRRKPFYFHKLLQYHTTTAVLSGEISYNNFTCHSLDFWHTFACCWLWLFSSLFCCALGRTKTHHRNCVCSHKCEHRAEACKADGKVSLRGRQFCCEFLLFSPSRRTKTIMHRHTRRNVERRQKLSWVEKKLIEGRRRAGRKRFIHDSR